MLVVGQVLRGHDGTARNVELVENAHQVSIAVPGSAFAHIWQFAKFQPEYFTQFLAPGQFSDIVKQRARSVGMVSGIDLTACQAIYKVSIHGAEQN